MITSVLALALVTTPVPPVAGGYSEVSTKATDVRQAALFAVRSAPEPTRLSWIINAQRQVVAGMNYRLCLGVKAADAGYFGKGRLVSAEVYVDLQQTYHLTSWQTVESCRGGL